jgi:hypothetical protein
MTSEERSCLGKVRHTTQRRACIALGKTNLRYHEKPGSIQVYRCRFCKGWHLGHVKLHPEPLRRMARPK